MYDRLNNYKNFAKKNSIYEGFEARFAYMFVLLNPPDNFKFPKDLEHSMHHVINFPCPSILKIEHSKWKRSIVFKEVLKTTNSFSFLLTTFKRFANFSPLKRFEDFVGRYSDFAINISFRILQWPISWKPNIRKISCTSKSFLIFPPQINSTIKISKCRKDYLGLDVERELYSQEEESTIQCLTHRWKKSNKQTIEKSGMSYLQKFFHISQDLWESLV